VEQEKDCLLLDGIYHRVLSLKNLPEGTIASALVPLIQGLRPTATADFRVVYGLNILPQLDVLRKLKLKGNIRQVFLVAMLSVDILFDIFFNTIQPNRLTMTS
jgi:hypothetical protein